MTSTSRHLTSLCVASALMFSWVAPATAQNADAYDEYFMSDEHRQKIYEQNRKKPGKAVLYNLALPGLGNFYTEQYLLGGVAIVLTAFAGTFVAYGLATEQTDILVIGAVTAGLAYGGSIGTSLYGVSEFNRKLRQGLKVEEAQVRELWTPTLVLRF